MIEKPDLEQFFKGNLRDFCYMCSKQEKIGRGTSKGPDAPKQAQPGNYNY